MKKRNGFTLIELLAVIIILAIVALVATPIIIDVIEDSRKSAAKSEAALILNGVSTYCSTEYLKQQEDASYVSICGDTDTDGNRTMTKENAAKTYSNSNAELQTDVTFTKDKGYSFTVKSNGYTVVVTEGKIADPT